MAISITEKTSTTNTTKATGRSIKYIVIHYTAGTSSAAGAAANTAAYFAKSSTKASADFIVDDSTIVQYNPDIANRYCWHCGGSKLSGSKGGSLYKTVTNKNSIGVEICSTNSTGTVKDANDSIWSFTSKALSKAKTLVKYLMEEYDIDEDHVVRHYDKGRVHHHRRKIRHRIHEGMGQAQVRRGLYFARLLHQGVVRQSRKSPPPLWWWGWI